MTMIREDGNEGIYMCSSTCPEGHSKEYTKISKTYCLGNCPEDAIFFYESERKCLKNCKLEDKHFFNDQNICLENLNDCESKFFLINPKKTIFFVKMKHLKIVQIIIHFYLVAALMMNINIV